jgi:hypothetical protein
VRVEFNLSGITGGWSFFNAYFWGQIVGRTADFRVPNIKKSQRSTISLHSQVKTIKKGFQEMDRQKNNKYLVQA